MSEKVALYLGVGARTLEKAEAVVAAADFERLAALEREFREGGTVLEALAPEERAYGRNASPTGSATCKLSPPVGPPHREASR